MTKYWYPTAFKSWGLEEIDAIFGIIDGDQYTMGANVVAFEEEFAAYHGRRFGIMVNSGSSANLLATASLFLKADKPLQRGDIAAVPALAWSTTYAPLVQHGLELLLLDADVTWNANVHQADLAIKAIKGDVRLLVACSVLGSPAQLDYMEALSHKSGCYLIEDNCESLGARTVSGRKTGTFGHLSTFSFYHSHQVSAIEGGMVLTNDEELANICRTLRDHGLTRSLRPAPSFDLEYDFVQFGYNVRPLEMHAAVARIQLSKLDDFIQNRVANLTLWRKLVQGLPLIHPLGHGFRSPFGIAFALSEHAVRETIVHALRDAGIDCRPPTGGSFRLHKYGERWSNQATPVADTIHNTGLFIGNAPYPIPDRIEKAAGVLASVLS